MGMPVQRRQRLSLAGLLVGAVVATVGTAHAQGAASLSLRALAPGSSDFHALSRQFGASALQAGSLRVRTAHAVSGASLAKASHVSPAEAQRDGFLGAYDAEYSNTSISQHIHALGGEVILLSSSAGAHRFLKHVVFSPFIQGELSAYGVKFNGGIKGLGDESNLLLFTTSKTTQTEIVTWRHGKVLARVSVLGPRGTGTFQVMLAEARRVDARLAGVR